MCSETYPHLYAVYMDGDIHGHFFRAVHLIVIVLYILFIIYNLMYF